MKEKTFQWTVLAMLGFVVLFLVIGAAAKKTSSQYGTSVSMFGKTLYQSKKLKNSMKEAAQDVQAEIIREHSLKPKEEAV